MTEPGGQPGSRRWTGRCYAHLLLPVPYLTGPAAELFDEAVGAADDWYPADIDAFLPELSRAWRRPEPSADRLVLTVLGWYPLLVTIGVDGARPSRGTRPGRRALQRVVTAALSVDGRWVPDRELPHRLASARDRTSAARALHRRAAEQRALLDRRWCVACRGGTAYQATHCDRCGRRFTVVDDAGRERHCREAAEELARCATALDELARDRPLHAAPSIAARRTGPDGPGSDGAGPYAGPHDGPAGTRPGEDSPIDAADTRPDPDSGGDAGGN